MAPDAYRDDAIVLVVTRNGRLFWRQDQISIDDLRRELHYRLEHKPQTQIFLAVDAHANFGYVANVLAALHSLGAERFVFLVDQRKINTSWTTYPLPPFWSLHQLWRSMDRLNQADLLLLAFMLANTGAILCFRLYRFSAFRRESSTFTRDAASPLREGNFGEVISITARNRRSHLANIFAEVLSAYASTRSDLGDTEAIALAQRSSQRLRTLLAARLKCGLSTFASIAASAPFIGFLGTINGILGCFIGGSGNNYTALARLASELARALLPGAMGIVVSILAVWCFYFVRRRCNVLETEMSNAELEAITCLKPHPQWCGSSEHSSVTTEIFNAGNATAAHNWEVPYDRHRPLLLAFWGCALYVAFLLAQAWS